MRTITLPNGGILPVLGQGTWRMGEKPAERAKEIDALRLGIDLGLRAIDTAEMYGSGGAEKLVGAAIAGRSDEVFVISKVLPENASHAGTIAACERSLKRLGLDAIDLYLLHWRGDHPLAETLAAFLDLQRQGKIKGFGISNFTPADMKEWLALDGAAGPQGTQVNQVMYNIVMRGIDFDLRPDHQKRGIAIMAYCPLALDAQSRAKREQSRALRRVAERHGVDPTTIALAWTIRGDGIMAIPKSSRAEALRRNAVAADIELTPEDIADLDRDFPPPLSPQPLAMT